MATLSAKPVSPVVVVASIVAVAALLMVVGGGPLYRARLVDLGLAFGGLKWGAWTGLGAAVLALVGAWLSRPSTGRRGLGIALAGVALGAVAFAVPFAMFQGARSVPPIHDITTDTGNPPRFMAVLALRQGAANPPDYAGESVAAQQRTGYPDIKPLTVAVPPSAAFDRALAAARDSGWDIVASVPSEGRIEATDTTKWFGFKDDVVVRITPVEGGSRIDVRSLSRIGRSDLGKNAARIRAYLERLRG